MARRTRVYFDHNVVDHAVKRHKITDGQIDQLRSIGKGEAFELTLSITNLDEVAMLAQPDDDGAEAGSGIEPAENPIAGVGDVDPVAPSSALRQ